jgi:hypothetical protein
VNSRPMIVQTLITAPLTLMRVRSRASNAELS